MHEDRSRRHESGASRGWLTDRAVELLDVVGDESAIRCAWRGLQQCQPGTLALAEALSLVTDVAALSGDVRLAEAAAEAHLGYHRPLKAAPANAATPIVLGAPGNGADGPPEALTETFPLRAGLIGTERRYPVVFARLVDYGTLGLPLGPRRG